MLALKSIIMVLTSMKQLNIQENIPWHTTAVHQACSHKNKQEEVLIVTASNTQMTLKQYYNVFNFIINTKYKLYFNLIYLCNINYMKPYLLTIKANSVKYCYYFLIIYC